MNAQFKRGILELCVLSLLVNRELYGYLIIDELSEHIDVSENSIYPILRRLTKDGYFETYLKESSQGAPRKYYRMTEKGFVYYLELREQWDSFIGGVYHIINQGGKKNEEIHRRFASSIEKKKHE
jgi:PadR family transcriptional regulator, regulatory protein PadR